MDEGETKVCDISDIHENTINGFSVNGQRLLVLKTSDGYIVANAQCPHKGGNLDKGTLLDMCTIECPWHHAHIDIKRGKAVKHPNATGIGLVDEIIMHMLPPLHTYEPVIQDGSLYIRGNVVAQKTL